MFNFSCFIKVARAHNKNAKTGQNINMTLQIKALLSVINILYV